MTTKPSRGPTYGTVATAAQLGGFAASGAGLYLLFGLAVTLVVCGLAVTALGVLAEVRGGGA